MALRFEYLDPATLAPQEKNPWTHPPAQADALAASLDQAGWAGAALYNETTGRLIDGHLRRTEAISRGETLPTLIGSWDEPTERLLLRTVNPVAMLAEADDALLAELTRAVEGDIAAGLLASDERLDALLKEVIGPRSGLVPGADPDAIPEQVETRCKPGDLWECGAHRLYVGDCTDAEAVSRLMAGERAKLLLTDPPYAVDYVEKARDMNRRGYGHSRAKRGAAIAGDGIEEGQEETLWRDAFTVALEGAVDEHAAIYVWFADQRTRHCHAVMEELGILHHQHMVWAKPNFVIGRCDYQWKHELCFYGWKRGSRPPFYGPRNQTTVWEIDRDTQYPEHPTQKPVATFTPPMRNHLQVGEIAYDPFVGSGTVFIAAEECGVRAFGCEVNTRHADTAIARHERATGRTARLLE